MTADNDKPDQFKEDVEFADHERMLRGMPSFWEQRRMEWAAMAMQGLCANPFDMDAGTIAKNAYDMAEAMVAECKKRNAK